MTDYIKREDAIEEVCKGCNEQFSEEPCETSDCCIMQRLADIPPDDVVEGVQRNEDFNRVIDELLETEAKNDIGYFTSTERRLFNSYVEDLLSMTIERADE